MQSAFRAQNPCLFSNGQYYYRKENAYVFDFDPARTLIIFEEFANDLSSGTSSGRGDSETREKNVRTLLNFFPVIGEDENGEMTLLDASQVLTIPRKIKSQEVVLHGFMSDFLFQNISHVFGAPQEVIDIIKTMEPVKETKNTPEQFEAMPDTEFDDNGDPIIPDDNVEEKTEEIFGPKIYIEEQTGSFIPPVTEEPGPVDEMLKSLEDEFSTNVTAPLMQQAADHYGSSFTPRAKKAAARQIGSMVKVSYGKAANDYKIKQNTLEAEREHVLEYSTSEEETEQIKLSFAEKMHEAACEFNNRVQELTSDLFQSSQEAIVKAAETEIVVTRKKTIEDGIKDHVRGFSRTIPSFLMAYGSDNVTLETFDTIVPDQVFLDVTSISLQQFRILRDGGEVMNPETHKKQYFEGHLFDAVVFNDSVKEFLGLKKKLADYFDEENKEDIFDYIPPQKTNQIFTPKVTVKDMVDRLEEENPGCYDDPDNKFADLYMKSGMYITEIVKRLYQSERMKLLYPDNTERLNHIFADQVYGLAPTEIIYRIALSYILGFSDDIKIRKHNIRCCDALALAKTGELEEKLKEMFPELSND